MKKYLLIFIFLFFQFHIQAQRTVIKTTSLSDTVIEIREWKVIAQDNPQFALPNYDDSNWNTIYSTQKYLTNDTTPLGIKWFRAHIIIDSSLRNTNHTLIYHCAGAMEIYLDGKLLVKNGIIAEIPDEQDNIICVGSPIPIHFDNKTHYFISVRYSLYRVLSKDFIDTQRNNCIFFRNVATTNIV